MWGVNDFIYERYEVLRDKHNFTPTKVLDIGAHFGNWYKTIKSIYPDAEVLSVEANPNCTTKLSRVNPNSIISLRASLVSYKHFLGSFSYFSK